MIRIENDFEVNMERPNLNVKLDSTTFQNYYYLKEELVLFCKQNGLQSTGSKLELTERIATFLKTGEKQSTKKIKTKRIVLTEIEDNTLIENPFICSEQHRAFFKSKIGQSFSFNVTFQKWLKNNSGKRYSDAIQAYYEIIREKKNNNTVIDKQFEYNTYIRDFFKENKGKSLKEAIRCWNYKKSKQGSNQYNKEDLIP